MSLSIYIVTKPLQYINVVNIKDANRKYLLAIDCFIEAKNFYHTIINISNFWDYVKIFNNKYLAVIWLLVKSRKLRISNIYIDSDFGIILHFFLYFLRKKTISVYEEGWGTYRVIRTNNKYCAVFKRYIYKLLGNNNRIGGSKFIKEIYLYHPTFYKRVFPDNSKILRKFVLPFKEHIHSFEEIPFIFSINDFSFLSGKNVVLYLTSHNYEDEIQDYLLKFINYYKILKPHPHLKHKKSLNEFDLIIQSNILAELVIISLYNVVNKLIIIHRNSNSVLYFLDLENVETINIGQNTNETFNLFAESLKLHP